MAPSSAPLDRIRPASRQLAPGNGEMQRPRAPPPRPSMRRSVSTLGLQWSIDSHQPRASTFALSGLADLQLLSPSSSSSSRRRKRVSVGERPSSPSARSTNDSLSSTLLTTTSSGVLELEWDEEDEEDDDTDSLDSRRRPPLSDWVYWQRDVVNHPECWTRVFAVYKASQLWLYRYEVANAQTLLLHMPVTRVEAGADGARQLKLLDISAGREVRICMLDVPTYEEWRLRIRDDVYAMADEMMEQRAERESGMETQPHAVVRTRQRSISGSHKGILRHALSTAVTNLKKSHSDPTGHLHRRELSTSASAPGFSTAPSAFPPPHSVQYKKSGWKSVKSKLSGVWKDKALHRHQRGERQQLEL